MIASELNLGSINKPEEGTGQQVLHVFFYEIYIFYILKFILNIIY